MRRRIDQCVERQPAVSPDGRLLAYSSDETGELEIYLRPFPTGTEKWPICDDSACADQNLLPPTTETPLEAPILALLHS